MLIWFSKMNYDNQEIKNIGFKKTFRKPYWERFKKVLFKRFENVLEEPFGNGY